MHFLDITFVKQLESNLVKNTQDIQNFLNLVQGMNKDCRDVLFYGEYDFRVLGEYNRIKNAFLDVPNHTAWKAFFQSFDLHHVILGHKHTDAVRAYQFNDEGKRSYYKDIKTLTPFNLENATAFFNKYLRDTTEKRAELLKQILGNCGSDYKKAPEKFSKKMTYRNIDTYNTNTTELGQFMQLVAFIVGQEFSWSKYWTELRNNRVINGNQFEPVFGVQITLELHQNGNATLRINDAELIKTLNAQIKQIGA